jgi:hypothetical protein
MKAHHRSTLLAGLIAAAAAGTAIAGGGDNGMNPFYGDSWAALEGNGVNVGGTAMLPGAGAAHVAGEASATQSFADRMNHAEAKMSEQWQHASASMSAAAHRMEADASPRATQPIVATPTNPFDDKAGN